MALNLGELVAVISADDSRFRRVMGGVQGALMKVGKLGALAALAGTATHLAVALAPAAGALAAMPALMIANKVAAYAFGLAMTGVGDALGAVVAGDMAAYQEALKAMPPAARRVVGNLAPAFRGLQATAQENFFKPMRKASEGVGRDLREPVGRGMATITAAMGRVGAKVLGVARDAKTLAFIPRLALAIAGGFDKAGKGVKPLLRGVRDFAAASLGSFTRLGAGAGNTMKKIGAWLSSKAAAGKPMQWISGAITRLKQLGRIAGDFGTTLKNIFKNAGEGQSGGLLTSIEKITSKMSDWSKSTEGQDKIKSFFAALNETAGHLSVILPIVGGALGMVASAIQMLPAPAQGAVSQFLAMSLIVGVIAGRLGPMARGVMLLGGALVKAGRVLGVGKALSWLSGRFKGAAAAAGRFAKSVLLAMGRAAAAAGRAALSVAASAGRMALSFAATALSATASAASSAASMTASAARVVGAWTMMALRAAASALIMAAQWAIAFWPVTLTVAAVAAAAFLIIKHWDKIKVFFAETLPKWIKKGATWIGNLIKNMARYGFLGPIGLIISHWDKIKRFFTETLPNNVSKGLNKVTGWLGKLPGRVTGAIGNMGSLLVNAGKNLLIGLWNGIVDRASWLARSIGNLIRRIIPGPVRQALGIASPSKLFAGYGRNLAEGLAVGMKNSSGLVSSAAAGLAGAASLGAGTVPGVGSPMNGRAGTGAGAGGAGAVPVVKLIVDLEGDQAVLKKRIRKIVRVDGRGSVQVAFAGRA